MMPSRCRWAPRRPTRPPDAPCLGGRSRADSGSGPLEAAAGAAVRPQRQQQGCASCTIC